MLKFPDFIFNLFFSHLLSNFEKIKSVKLKIKFLSPNGKETLHCPTGISSVTFEEAVECIIQMIKGSCEPKPFPEMIIAVKYVGMFK